MGSSCLIDDSLVRFIIDAQLPPALARSLEAAGHQAQHVAEIGLRDEADSLIWDHALKHQAVILTKDEDFAARVLKNPKGPRVVWLRIGNSSRRALIRWFNPLLPQILDYLQKGDRLIEVR